MGRVNHESQIWRVVLDDSREVYHHTDKLAALAWVMERPQIAPHVRIVRRFGTEILSAIERHEIAAWIQRQRRTPQYQRSRQRHFDF